MSMDTVRRWYGVPAKRGGRVAYAGSGKRELGTIRSAARGVRLNVQLDGAKRPIILHPTWALEYITEPQP